MNFEATSFIDVVLKNFKAQRTLGIKFLNFTNFHDKITIFSSKKRTFRSLSQILKNVELKKFNHMKLFGNSIQTVKNIPFF